MEESLYDTWQMPYLLNVPCTVNKPMSGCNQTEMTAIEAFRNETERLLKQAQEMSNTTRTVWAPACPFHCKSRYGQVNDPTSAKYVVPENSNNTLGEVSHWFIFED